MDAAQAPGCWRTAQKWTGRRAICGAWAYHCPRAACTSTSTCSWPAALAVATPWPGSAATTRSSLWARPRQRQRCPLLAHAPGSGCCLVFCCSGRAAPSLVPGAVNVRDLSSVVVAGGAHVRCQGPTVWPVRAGCGQLGGRARRGSGGGWAGRHPGRAPARLGERDGGHHRISGLPVPWPLACWPAHFPPVSLC